MDNVITPTRDRLIWIDLEMTGLDPDNDRIIEIATVVTDWQLNTVAEGPVMVIHQPNELLEGMDEWNTRQHTKSGLIDRVKASHISEQQAQAETLSFLTKYVEAGASPMCGNSICQDRRFLYRYMPTLERFFHYRNLDVSTIKMLAQRWAPQVYGGIAKQAAHLALQDVYESIAELKHYRNSFFKIS